MLDDHIEFVLIGTRFQNRTALGAFTIGIDWLWVFTDLDREVDHSLLVPCQHPETHETSGPWFYFPDRVDRWDQRMGSPERVAGIDVSGTEFQVRFGDRSKWFGIDRGWYIYGPDGGKRGRILPSTHSRIFSRSGSSLTSRVQNPYKETVLELRRVEGGSKYGGEAARYDLVDVETEQRLGTFQQHESLSAHWSYRIHDLDEYAVVTVPAFRWGRSTTIDRPNGPTICHIDFSLTGMVHTLSMEPLHPRLKALILATGFKVGGARY